MTPAFIAGFLARKGSIGSDMRRVLLTGFKALSPVEKFAVFAAWYAADVDGCEAALGGMPGGAEFRDRLIENYQRTHPR